MNIKLSPMDRFSFLIGRWKLKYNVPGSIFSKKDEGYGTGEFKRLLNDKYVSFDYSASLLSGKASAHAIFSWDDKSKIYRYWWFEDSGNFQTAACNFY